MESTLRGGGGLGKSPARTGATPDSWRKTKNWVGKKWLWRRNLALFLVPLQQHNSGLVHLALILGAPGSEFLLFLETSSWGLCWALSQDHFLGLQRQTHHSTQEDITMMNRQFSLTLTAFSSPHVVHSWLVSWVLLQWTPPPQLLYLYRFLNYLETTLWHFPGCSLHFMWSLVALVGITPLASRCSVANLLSEQWIHPCTCSASTDCYTYSWE